MTYVRTNLLMRILYAASWIRERAWHVLTQPVCERYRPEQHYMRGPGPKNRAQGIERTAIRS